MLKFFNFFITHKFIFVIDLFKLFFYQCFSTIIASKDIVIDVFAATRGLICYIIYAINNITYEKFIIEFLTNNKSYSKINNCSAIIALREVAEMYGIITSKFLQKLLVDYSNFRQTSLFSIYYKIKQLRYKIKKFFSLLSILEIIIVIIIVILILIIGFIYYWLFLNYSIISKEMVELLQEQNLLRDDQTELLNELNEQNELLKEQNILREKQNELFETEKKSK